MAGLEVITPQLREQCTARIRALQTRLRAEQQDGAMLTQNVDLYYYNGSMQNGFLFVPTDGDPRFYVKRSVIRAQAESACAVVDLGSLRTLASKLAADYPQLFDGRTLALATNMDTLPVQWYKRLESIVPQAVWQDSSLWSREIRMIKSAQEIAVISEAARVVHEALDQCLVPAALGQTELAWMADIEYELRKRGHAGIMRMRGYNQEIITGILGAGAAGATPTYFDGPGGGLGLHAAVPQSVSHTKVTRNQPVLLDIGCCINGYVIDQTRTAVFGQLDEKLQRAYDAAVHILRSTEQRLKPGTICEELYMASLQLAEEAGLAAHYMGFGADQVKFLGHGIGLEVDELPVLAKGFRYPLEAGMVIAIEPKFSFPGEGVVGIENTYVITETGFECLTVYPEQVVQIKA